MKTSCESIRVSQTSHDLRNRRKAPRGFTLIELFVVLVVIVVLISLLLPSVECAREAARRAQCTNNLKQIGLACLNCESALHHLPVGGWSANWCGNPDSDSDTEQPDAAARQPGGPIYNILPYLECAPLYKIQAGTTGDARTKNATSMLSTPLAALICPSRRPVQTFPQISGKDTLGFPIFDSRYVSDGEITGITMVARNDYAGNGYDYVSLSDVDALKTEIAAALGASGGSGGTGTARMNAIFADDDKRATLLTFMRESAAGKGGVFFPTSAVTMDQISDGTDCTYLFGEKYVCPDDYLSGKEHGDCFDMYGGAGPDVLRYSAVYALLLNNPNGVAGGAAAAAYRDAPGLHPGAVWGSPHVGGFNMAFCNGSVHTLSFNIDRKVNDHLANRADGDKTDPASLNNL
jgi:prepilin-type N-terminal cleavage/methylation domain-containing protein